MWSLAFAFESNVERARTVERLFRHDSSKSAALLAHWLDKCMRSVDADDVTAPWATKLIQELVHHIERSSEALAPETLRLPCRDCGMAFTSRLRAARYGRKCSNCFPYEPTVPAHPRGGLVQVKRGGYPNRRKGQTLGVTEYGTSIVCAHPDCLELVLVTRSDRDYCNEHLGKREEARRLRRSRPAKCERFAFSLAPEVTDVTYAWGARAEVTEVGPAGRVARDDEELLTLVQLAASGALLVTDTLA